MATRAQIIEEARAWIGTRWQHQASVRGAGCDCIGLVRGVARAVGLYDPFAAGDATRYAGYGRPARPDLALEACAAYLDRVELARAAPGDVLLFLADDLLHFGILSSLDPAWYMVHAYARSPRRVVENSLGALWQGRLAGAFAFRGVA